jgi:hypothetical protein
MLRAILLLLTVLLFTRCQKVIDKKVENEILKAMTSGQWKVSNYAKGSSNETAAFAEYAFQFYENRTVEAIKNSAVEKTGTWAEDASKLTIQATFDNVPEPLILLNGTWQITRTTWTSVDAFQTVNGEQRVLKLNKL